MVLTPVRSMSGISGLQMDESSSIQVGKISSRYFAMGAKNNNLAGQSGIGVIVVRFSRIRALKKHALLVFISYCGTGNVCVLHCSNSK